MSSPPSSVSPTSNDRKLFDDAEEFCRKRRWQEAKTAFNTLIDRFPGDPSLWYYRGTCWRKLGRMPEAKADYEQTIILCPSFGAAVYNLGAILQKNDELDGAIAVCSTFLQHNPNNTPILNLRAVCYDMKKRYDLSMIDYKQILSLEQKVDYRVNALINSGIAFRGSGEYKKALDAYSDALKLSQDNPNVLYNRATCYKYLGNSKAAESNFKSALEYYRMAESDLESAYNHYPAENPGDKSDCQEQLKVIRGIIASCASRLGAASAHAHDQSSSSSSSQSFFPPVSSSSASQSSSDSSSSASASVAPMIIPAVPQPRSSAANASSAAAASWQAGVLAAGSESPSSSASFQVSSSSSPYSAAPASAAASQSSASASSESESSMSPSSHSGTPRMGYP